MEYILNNLKSNKKEGLALLQRSFLKYKAELLATFFFLMASAIGTAAIPKLVEYAINTSIAQKDISGLMNTALIILVISLATTAFIYFRTIFANTLSQKVLFDLRKSVFEKLQELPLAFYSDNQTGDIIQRITENVSGVDRFFTQGLMRLLDVIFLVMLSLVFMAFTDIKLTLVSIMGIVLIFVFLMIQGRILKTRLDIALKRESEISSFVEESLEGHKTIASFDKEKPFLDDFKEVNDRYYSSIISAYRISSLPESVLSLIGSAVLLSSLYLSLVMSSNGEILPGTVLLFVYYTISIFRNLSGVSRMWTPFQNGISSAQRIDQILKLHTDITNDKKPYSPDDKDIKGDIVFRNVEFSYGGRTKVLENINFSVSAGKSVAIVGPTGAGKTTFVNLIARLYDIDKGSILFDGIDLKKWDLKKLRGQIGYLIQETFLFEDTILNNLKYSNPGVTKEDALRTFQQLGAERFIEELPDGLDTKLEAEGKNLSSGQRQIIALARVLLRKPKILILDEATSKIDTKSEKMIQKAIDIARKGNTSFIIAHRLSTIFNADLIVVIQENRILEQGSHDELIRKRGKYYEMYSKFVGN